MSVIAQEHTDNLAALYDPEEQVPEARRHRKEHTYCFMCARTFFSRVLDRCLHCASNSVQHYTSHDLTLLAHRAM